MFDMTEAGRERHAGMIAYAHEYTLVKSCETKPSRLERLCRYAGAWLVEIGCRLESYGRRRAGEAYA